MSTTTPSGPGAALTATLDDATAGRVQRLGLATAASALFALIGYEPLHWVDVPVVIAVILVVAGALAVAGARTGRAALAATAGAVLLVLGLVRLVSYGLFSGGLGSASTAGLLTGLGLSLLGVLLARSGTR